ncbi:MAG: hypothetical protein ACFFDQ_05050 [Candidatus Thorarchaeota archaeon]
MPRAIDDFERYCLGLLNELSLSEEILEKIGKTVKILRHELNEDAYLRVFHIWQESFSALAETAFDGLGTDQLLEKASKREIQETLESDWLKRFDIVESVTAYVLLDAEKRFREKVSDTINDSLIAQFGSGEIIEVFIGSWACSLGEEMRSKSKLCNFILCENALLTNILYSPALTEKVKEEWWIAPKNTRPLIFYIPFGIVNKVTIPSNLSHWDGISPAAYDLKLQLRVEDSLEENRLPYVMNRLRMLRHMVVFNEVDIHIHIMRNEDEPLDVYNERKFQIRHLIGQQANMSLSSEYSIAMIVEGEPRAPYDTPLSCLQYVDLRRYF